MRKIWLTHKTLLPHKHFIFIRRQNKFLIFYHHLAYMNPKTNTVLKAFNK